MSKNIGSKKKGKFNFNDFSQDQLAGTSSNIHSKSHQRGRRIQFHNDPNPLSFESHKESPYQQLQTPGSEVQNKSNTEIRITRDPQYLVEKNQDGGKLQKLTADSFNEGILKKDSRKGKKFAFSSSRLSSQQQESISSIEDAKMPTENESQFSEALLSSLLRNQYQKFKVHHLQKGISPSLHRTQLFFDLLSHLDHKDKKEISPELIETKQKNILQVWTSGALSYLLDYRNYQNISKVLHYILTDNVGELVDEKLVDGQPEQAYQISILKGRLLSAEPPPQMLLKKFKRQFNNVQIQNINMLGMSVWVYDLAIAIQFYNSIPLRQAISSIFRKYKRSDFLQSEFLLLGLTNKTQDRQIKQLLERQLRSLQNEPKESGLKLDHIFLLVVIKKYLPNEQFFKRILQEIIKKMNNLEEFIKILEFSNASKAFAIELLKIFTQNHNLASGANSLYDYFKTTNRDGPHNFYKNLMNQILVYGYLNRCYNKKEYSEFLKQLINSYRLIHESSLINFSDVLEKLQKILTSFTFACRADREEKRELYKQLIKIEQFLRYDQSVEKGKYLSIVRGTIAFIQLQLGIFNLNESQNLKRISSLVSSLRGLLASEKRNSLQYLKYIQQIIVKHLSSRHGRIYLQRVCNIENSINRQEIINQLPKLNVQAISSFSEEIQSYPLIKILSVVNCRIQIRRNALIQMELC